MDQCSIPPPRSRCRARRHLVIRMPLVAVFVMLLAFAAKQLPGGGPSTMIMSVQATAVSSAAPIFIPVGGSSQPTSAASPSTAVVGPSTVIVTPDDNSSSSSSNMIIALVGYLKDTMVRTVTGCGQLWTNHGKCNEIRQKQKQYRLQIQQEWEKAGLYEDESPQQIQKRLLRQVQGGITFAEYMFLQRGKEDRSKVLNFAFLAWGAPKFLPYALMFNPDLLPSPFQVDKNPARDWSREQSQAIVTTLVTMEQQMTAAAGGLAGINIFGKKAKQSKKQVLEHVVAEAESFLGQQPLPSSAQLFEKLAPYVYKTDTVDYSRAEQRLCQVPPCIVQGLSRAISGQGGLPGVVQQLTPAFMHRGKLVGHMQKLAAEDDFLVQAEIDLTTMSKRVLQEVCRERLLPSSSSVGADELRTALADWLQQAVREPTATLQRLQEELPTVSSDDSKKTKTALPMQAFYNGNLARMALLAYNGCAMCRNGSAASRMPRLLYTGGNIDGNDGKSSTDISSSSTKKKSSKASPSTSNNSSVEGNDRKAASASAKRSRNAFRK